MSGRKPKKSTVTLASHLGVTPDKLEGAGVLNVILGIDTKLFIEPKLIEETDAPEFADARKEVIRYFDRLLKVYAQAALSNRLHIIARDMIAIKEPVGLAIGYGNSRDSGTAISTSVAEASLRSLKEMIAVGVNDIQVMEMLGLFIKKFGSDSISDLIAHIIYDDLCRFTERVSKELGVRTQRFELPSGAHWLPVHPSRKHQIVFVPLNFLSPLPLATSWREVAHAAQVNARVRRDFNTLVGTNIKRFAKRVKDNPNILAQSPDDMQTILEAYKGAKARPYDIDFDTSSYYRLAEFATKLERASKPVAHGIKTAQQMIEFIEKDVIPRYRRHIEQLGANELLYQRTGKKLQSVDPTKPVHEEAIQVLFFLVADDACAADDVIVSRESRTAAGAVDFSLGTGYMNKVLAELKKSNNGNLLDGYKNQVDRYMQGENAADAFYLIVIVDQKDITNEKSQLNQVKKLHAEQLANGDPTPRLVIINGLIRKTASKLHGENSSESITMV